VFRLNRRSLLQDLIAGLTGAVAGAPQSMGFALIAGISPVYGLYSGFLATIIGSFTSSSTYLTIAPTNALSLVVFSTFADAKSFSIEQLFALTLLVGVFQLAFGLLRLGDLTRFVSNAVMTGFITGAGLLIILGQVANFTGYIWPDSITGTLPKFADWLLHVPQWNAATTGLGLFAVAVIWVMRRLKLKTVATLTAIVIVSGIVAIFGLGQVATVKDIAPIPPGLPSPVLPDFASLPALWIPGAAMAVLALVQSTGITQNIREPDGTAPEPNRDFIAQGLANIGSSFFQGMPSGGSLSRTAVNVNAGAQTRLANIFAGAFIGLTLLFLGRYIELVTLNALAAQLILAAASLIRPRLILVVWNVRMTARIAMVTTFISTLILPLEFSIYIGVVLSLVLYIYTSSQNIKIIQLEQMADGRFGERPLPEALPEHAPIIISVHGHLYFAAVRQLEKELPPPQSAQETVVILRLRNNVYLGSTGIQFLKRYAAQLQKQNGKLILAGISPAVREQLTSTGTIDILGEGNIFYAQNTILGATEDALIAAYRWLDSKHM